MCFGIVKMCAGCQHGRKWSRSSYSWPKLSHCVLNSSTIALKLCYTARWWTVCCNLCSTALKHFQTFSPLGSSQKVSWYSENISPAVRLWSFLLSRAREGDGVDEKSDFPPVYGVLRVYDFFSAEVEMSERGCCVCAQNFGMPGNEILKSSAANFTLSTIYSAFSS